MNRRYSVLEPVYLMPLSLPFLTKTYNESAIVKLMDLQFSP